MVGIVSHVNEPLGHNVISLTQWNEFDDEFADAPNGWWFMMWNNGFHNFSAVVSASGFSLDHYPLFSPIFGYHDDHDNMTWF